MRLVTRPDLDGLTCAVLLSECEALDSVELVHPQDVSERRVPIGPQDIVANLLYHPACGMWFDNHLLTDPKAMPPAGFKGRYGKAPSAARLVYEHYAKSQPGFARHDALVAETDRLDSAQLTLEDVLSPGGYVLLGLTLDSRTGLGSLREYFDELWPAVRERSIDQVLALPSVRERVARMREQDQAFRAAARARSRLDGDVVVTDFRATARSRSATASSSSRCFRKRARRSASSGGPAASGSPCRPAGRFSTAARAPTSGC